MSAQVEIFFQVGVRLFNAFLLSNFWEYHYKSYIAKNQILGLNFYFREYWFDFNHFNVIGRKAAEVIEIT